MSIHGIYVHILFVICVIALRGKPKEERRNLQIEFVNTQSKEKDTALHVAAQAGYEETVKTLVSIGADVNKRTDTKQTPLHLAAISGQANVVRYLVMHHANINAKDEDFMTPLHRSVRNRFLQSIFLKYFYLQAYY